MYALCSIMHQTYSTPFLYPIGVYISNTPLFKVILPHLQYFTYSLAHLEKDVEKDLEKDLEKDMEKTKRGKGYGKGRGKGLGKGYGKGYGKD